MCLCFKYVPDIGGEEYPAKQNVSRQAGGKPEQAWKAMKASNIKFDENSLRSCK